MCMFWGFWLSQRIAEDSVLLGCDSLSGKWLPSYVSPRVEHCKSFFVLGPWETLQDKDTAVFKTSGSTHPTTERHISGCSLFLCLRSAVTASRSCYLQHLKQCAETRTTQLASKVRSLHVNSHLMPYSQRSTRRHLAVAIYCR
jgi:hypothetical protein